MKYKHRSEYERIINKLSNTIYDTEPVSGVNVLKIKDNKCRNAVKEKLMTKDIFKPVLQNNFKSRHDKQVWNCVEDYALRTEYIGGYKEIEERIRGKEKYKETKRFNSVNARDTWKDRAESTSLRKGISDKAMAKIISYRQRFENALGIEYALKKLYAIDDNVEEDYKESTYLPILESEMQNSFKLKIDIMRARSYLRRDKFLSPYLIRLKAEKDNNKIVKELKRHRTPIDNFIT